MGLFDIGACPVIRAFRSGGIVWWEAGVGVTNDMLERVSGRFVREAYRRRQSKSAVRCASLAGMIGLLNLMAKSALSVKW